MGRFTQRRLSLSRWHSRRRRTGFARRQERFVGGKIRCDRLPDASGAIQFQWFVLAAVRIERGTNIRHATDGTDQSGRRRSSRGVGRASQQLKTEPRTAGEEEADGGFHVFHGIQFFWFACLTLFLRKALPGITPRPDLLEADRFRRGAKKQVLTYDADFVEGGENQTKESMKTNSPTMVVKNPAGLTEPAVGRPAQATRAFPESLPAIAASKAYLRALRQVELEYWQQSGGDYLRAKSQSLKLA